ncbi:MAG: hypothetical protein HY869_03995 [Chloroflexi bacterium]|nr:hypothetical protein [Chloroflexota bacterium]
MRNQIVQWIFLPGGLTEDGQLAASIFVTPRLRSDEGHTLADFPDFVDWPALVGSGQLQVTLQRGDGVTEAPMQVIGSGSRELWQALFPADTLVRPFIFEDYADRPLVSYPYGKVLEYLKGQWASLARASIDDLPFSSSNVSPVGPLVGGQQLDGHTLSGFFDELMVANRTGIFKDARDAKAVSDNLAGVLRGVATQAAALRAEHATLPQDLIQPFNQGDSTPGHFYQLATFHRRPEADPSEFPADHDAAIAELNEKLEFHHLLSTLGDHPELLRSLGLVFDLIIRPDFLPTLTDQDPPTLVKVSIQRSSNFPTRSNPAQSPWNLDVTPFTQCRLVMGPAGASFSAAELPGSHDFAHGFVNLNPQRFLVAAVDVDGLALKALNMASTLETQEQQSQRPVEEEARAGTPAPRTGGVALAIADRAQDIHDDFYLARKANDALELDPTNPPVLVAEQLVRGYRLDIFDSNTNAWRSLHARQVTYTPLRDSGQAFSVEDEGFVQVSLTGDVDRPGAPADPDGALYVHEALVTWDGWSLAVPRPGTAIPQEPAPPAASAEFGPLQLDLAVKALPASLPRLRFGVDYRLRLRTVDLAGRSLPLSLANNLSFLLDRSGLPELRVTLPDGRFVYRRLEPVPPPELTPRFIYSPGEGLERLVVRSNAGVSSADYAAISQSAPDETLIYHPFCDRHVAPPKASLQLTEAHGLFDKAIDSVRGLSDQAAADAAAHFYEIARRENGSFRDHPDSRFIPTGNHQDQPQGYVTIDADGVTLPYLPDPVSRGVLIRLQFSPIEPEQRFEIAFDQQGDWYELLPFRLRLEEGEQASTQYDDAQHLFTVRLPKGRIARMRLNSLFLDDPDLFEIMAWCHEKLSPADAENVLQAIRESRHWMTTPWRTLNLVHAVQQPLFEPSLDLEDIVHGSFKRKNGATVAELAGRVRMDGASTASLDLTAEWEDMVDDPALGPLVDEHNLIRPVHTNAFKIVLPEPFATPWGDEIEKWLKAEDTDGGQEWNSVIFSSRENPDGGRTDLLRLSAAPALTVQERNRLAAAAVQLEGFRSHEFGDTKYREVTYQIIAAARFREYFDPSLPVEQSLLKGNLVKVDMLSSANPPAPVVLDIVPIARWEREGEAGSYQYVSTRRSAGLRVWLSRPWFTSGAGEMLGLVCGRGGPLAPSVDLYREMSIISQDPAHASVLPQPLRTQSFPGADLVAENVPLPLHNLVSDLVAFKPRYDPKRDAWYCDIAFETSESYFPFVRLGLVRYQPKSLQDCQVSAIVPAAFLQPLPDRSLTVVRQAPDKLSVKLRGPGPRGHRGVDGSLQTETNQAAAVVEVQETYTNDPALGWIPTGEETLLAAVFQGQSNVEWSGEVLLPAPDGRPLRLAVREFEVHPTDDRSGPTLIQASSRRLVHFDVVPIE